jgi:regulator of protease activity HflC (stomatin/prohibitin superfamily)
MSFQAEAEALLTSDFNLDSETPLNKTILQEEEKERARRLDNWRERWRQRWRRFRIRIRVLGVLLFLLLFVWVFRKQMIFTVNSGEVLVIYYRFFGGTGHNSVGLEGLHIIAPWDKAYIYVVRTQTLVVPMTVLTRNGIAVHLDAQARFHAIPETVPYLHRRYGPNYVKDIITPGLIESVQGVIGQFLPEEIYSSESGASSKQVFANARRVIGGVFVDVEDIALFNVRLPARVEEAVENKAAAEQAAEAAVFNEQRAEFDAKAVQRYDDIVKVIPQSILVEKGIEATLELAKSPNTKIIVMGSKDNLPLLLGNVPDVVGK